MGVSRIDVVQRALDQFVDPVYLEIGVQSGRTFHALTAKFKVAVDPIFAFDVSEFVQSHPQNSYHEVTSDAFFAECPTDRKFDVIYLDGLHTFEQTLRDLMNAFGHCHDGTIIIIDDIFPSTFAGSLPNRDHADIVRKHSGVKHREWMGDVYKLTMFVDSFCPMWNFRCVEENHGQMVMWRSPRREITDRTMLDIALARYDTAILQRSHFKFMPLAEIMTVVEQSRDVSPLSAGPAVTTPHHAKTIENWDSTMATTDIELAKHTKPAESVLDLAQLRILQGKTWRYLRYIHARTALERVKDDVSTIVTVGAGHGWAEVALAVEYPEKTFTLTDIIDREHGYPNYHAAMSFCWQHGIDNVRFSVWNVMAGNKRRFDMVMSTEVLEHIEDDDRAAAMMRRAATKYIYCMVPYADEGTNDSPDHQRRVWEKSEHYRPGYTPEKLTELFPDPLMIAGAYWQEHGLLFRRDLTDMTLPDIAANAAALKERAAADLIDRIPASFPEAYGISILSRIRDQ